MHSLSYHALSILVLINSFPAGYTPDLPVAVTITSSGTPVAGQSFTLTCQATTTLASPSYQWFDDGGNLVGNVSTLTLNPLLESNTGEYSCQVTQAMELIKDLAVESQELLYKVCLLLTLFCSFHNG